MHIEIPSYTRVFNAGATGTNWKSEYLLDRRWLEGRVTSMHTLKGHTAAVTCVTFNKNICISGSLDTTGTCLLLPNSHPLSSLLLFISPCPPLFAPNSAFLFISFSLLPPIRSSLLTVKVWNTDKHTCTHTLTGHKTTIKCIEMLQQTSNTHQQAVVTYEGYIRFYDLNTMKSIHSQQIHAIGMWERREESRERIGDRKG